MPAPRPASRLPLFGAALCLSLSVSLTARAQDAPTDPQDGVAPQVDTLPSTPILSLDEERLFIDTRFGQAVLSRHRAEMEALLTENRRIEAALEAEERDLTARRARLPVEEFQTLAAAFDDKAEGIRAAQTAKDRILQQRLESERQRFFQAVVPVLAQLLQESGAVAIIDKRAVVLSFDRIDMTAVAVARMDEVLGDGGTPPDGTEPAGGASASQEDQP